MRIAMVDPSLFTLPYDRCLVAALRHAGHDVALHGRALGVDDSDAGDVRVTNSFYRVSGTPFMAQLPRGLLRTVKGADHVWSMLALLARLRREQPDVVHFQWLPLPALDHPMLRLMRRIAPLVLTVHDTNPFNGDRALRWQAAGTFHNLDLFGRLIVHTAQGNERLRARGLGDGRVVVIPHGPLAMPRTAPTDEMALPRTFVLFGKLKPYKGADVLIAAFAALPPELRRQARLHIVGKPYMDLAPLFASVRKNEIEREVSIEPRFVADDEIRHLFHDGSVATFPYRDIDSSGVLSQALAQGRPVIASRLGSFAETLTDGVHGVLVPVDDVAALSAAMARMIVDREFAAQCAKAAVELAHRAESWDAIAEMTSVTYRALLAEIADGAGTAESGTRRETVISNSTRNSMGGNC